MIEPLIPILPAVQATRIRQEHDLSRALSWHYSNYNKENSENKMRLLRIWIWKHTEGPFYLSRTLVAFQDDKDFVLFKLMWKDNA